MHIDQRVAIGAIICSGGTMKLGIAEKAEKAREKAKAVKERITGFTSEIEAGVRDQFEAERRYSGMDRIPDGRASRDLVPGCVCLEGGAFRGLYTQGLLDYWMLNGLNIADAIGVSAGALSAVAYITGQIGRSARVNIGHRHDPKYIGMGAIRRARSPINLDYLLHDYDRIEPLDMERFNDPARRLVAVATDCDTGKPEYFERGRCSDMFKALKATASMPFLAPMVELDGHHYLDGGCSCNIPYQWALDQGYEKIVVVKTHDKTYRHEDPKEKNSARRVYRRHQEFASVLDHCNIRYQQELDELDRLAESGRIFLIQPSQVVTVGRVEKDVEKLGELYWMGYYDAAASFGALKAYLGV